jgi:hypothetical protein
MQGTRNRDFIKFLLPACIQIHKYTKKIIIFEINKRLKW